MKNIYLILMLWCLANIPFVFLFLDIGEGRIGTIFFFGGVFIILAIGFFRAIYLESKRNYPINHPMHNCRKEGCKEYH